jgi:glycine cleavage system aminomethyltransferase T
VTGALDFLSPGLAEPAAVARSSLERCQRDAGATFEERGGWLVPVSIPGEDAHLAHVGIADLSHVTKLEVRPAGDAPEAPGSVWYPLSRRRALCFCHVPQLAEVRAQLADRLVLDVTAAYAVLALQGPAASTLLRRLTHLHHFPSGGDVAHVTAHVLEQAPGYWIVVAQEYGHYLWEVAVDRAGPLGGGPVGVDAIGALR